MNIHEVKPTLSVIYDTKRRELRAADEEEITGQHTASRTAWGVILSVPWLPQPADLHRPPHTKKRCPDSLFKASRSLSWHTAFSANMKFVSICFLSIFFSDLSNFVIIVGHVGHFKSKSVLRDNFTSHLNQFLQH